MIAAAVQVPTTVVVLAIVGLVVVSYAFGFVAGLTCNALTTWAVKRWGARDEQGGDD